MPDSLGNPSQLGIAGGGWAGKPRPYDVERVWGDLALSLALDNF